MKKLTLVFVLLSILAVACKKADERHIAQKWKVVNAEKPSWTSINVETGWYLNLKSDKCAKVEGDFYESMGCASYSLKNDTLHFEWTNGQGKWIAVIQYLSKDELVIKIPGLAGNNGAAPYTGADYIYTCERAK